MLYSNIEIIDFCFLYFLAFLGRYYSQFLRTVFTFLVYIIFFEVSLMFFWPIILCDFGWVEVEVVGVRG